MAISNLSLVNQKLAYAKVILADMASSAENAVTHKLHQQALAEGVLHHLAMAFHFYLREIADQYRIKNTAAINSLDDLLKALDLQGLSPSEVTELAALRDEKGSWLNSLQIQKNALFKSPEKQKEKKAFVTEAAVELVSAVEINEVEPSVLSLELLSSLTSDFSELIKRHRNTYAEY